MLKRVFNLRNIYSTTAFVSLVIGVPAAVEGEMYITAVILIAIFGVSAYLAMREDGTFRQKNRPR